MGLFSVHVLMMCQSRYWPGRDDGGGIVVSILTWVELEDGGFVLCYW